MRDFPRPSLEDLTAAREKFLENETRNLFYRSASELVDLAITGRTSLAVSEALAVLLQTWNRSFYRFRKFDSKHFAEIEKLLQRHGWVASELRSRSILSLRDAEREKIEEAFGEFEKVLGPVGASKTLHLLAPQFFPLWDRAIGDAYGLALERTGTNHGRYFAFMRLARSQCDSLQLAGTITRDSLKLLENSTTANTRGTGYETTCARPWYIHHLAIARGRPPSGPVRWPLIVDAETTGKLA
jgi:hypothetical protein